MTQQQVTHGASSLQEAPDAPLAAVRVWPSEAARTWTIDALRQAERDAAIQAIVASGSAICEVPQSDDLDLVLVYQGRRASLPRPPIDVDLRQYEQDEVARRLEAGHDYLSSVVRHGQALFDRAGWWSRLRAGWDGRLPLPSGADARARARGAQRLCEEMQAIGDIDAAAELRLSTLTHLARAALSDAGVFPQSRPELVGQLRGVGEGSLADRLADALAHRYG
ncbi:MAG: hypothetical protein OXG38_10635 [Chloroflexi bacterium]|nr:hypothetical protein [Chloroflexota bacterium]